MHQALNMLNSIHMKNCKVKTGLFFILVFTITTANAQQSDTLSVELDEIQINAIQSTLNTTDAPLSVSLQSFSASQRNSQLPLTLDQISTQLPGLHISDRQNYALGERISIRGMGWRASFGVRGIQVVMDGIPLTVADGQAMLNSVDPTFISEIELLRGPAASFWGNSSGGVLYLSTISAEDNNPGLSLRSSMGSYGTSKQDLQFSKSSGRHTLAGYASYLNEDGFREHSSAQMARSGVRGRVNFSDDSRLQYMGAFVGMPKSQHPSALTKENARENPTQAVSNFVENEAGKEVYQGQLGLNYRKSLSIGTFNVTGYGLHRDLTNPLPFGIVNVDRWAGGLRATLEQSFDNLTLNAGFDSKYQHDDRLEVENDGGQAGDVQLDQLETVNNQAFFATSALSLGKLDLLGGLRYDWLTFYANPSDDEAGERTFQSLNPSLGIAYSLNEQKIYSNFSTSFEAPTTTELVNNPEGQSGFNPELQPEKTYGVELGAKGSIGGSRFIYDAAIYQLWIENLLFPYQLEDNGPDYYRNQGKTMHRGFETGLSYALNNSLNLDATYNYISATFQGTDSQESNTLAGNDVPGIPSHRLNLGADYGSKHWQMGLAYEFNGSFAADNENTAYNDSYGVFNTTLSYIHEFKDSPVSLQPFLNIRNIMDTRYNGSVAINAFGGRFFEPAPGRNWQAGLSINFH